jgi:predicted metal-dependent phosphoesterase TrpH
MKTTYKIDLHSHSIISPDGGITATQYEAILEKGTLDAIAITDHNQTRFAKELHKTLGDRIIVGEEIKTKQGEMVGLYLTKTIPSGLSAKETAKKIHEQGGLVLIPHPFETLRKGIQKADLEKIHDDIDIIEVFNGRGRWRGKAHDATSFAKEYTIAGCANSDAHGYPGLGVTYSVISAKPERMTLRKLLEQGSLTQTYAPIWTFLYPAYHRVKNRFIQSS